MKCEPRPLDLPALCRQIIAQVDAATEHAVAIEFAAANLDGKTHLDETLTGIILTNLLNNAVKYSPT
jgi:signal transduction histidine kinase